MHFDVNKSGQETTIHQTPSQPFALYNRRFIQSQGDEIPLHWHDEFQIVWVDEGSFHYTIDSQSIELGPKEGIIINSHVLHGATLATPVVHYSCFDFSSQFINDHIYSQICLTIKKNQHILYQRLSLNESQYYFLSTMSLPMDDLQRLFVYDLFTTSLLQLAKSTTPFAKTKEPIYQLLSYVQSHYAEKLSVSDIARSASISPHICTKLFRTHTNLTPINYVIDYRLAKAKIDLLETDDTIADICLRVGFNHFSYFCKKFRQKYHTTPLAFRKVAKKYQTY